MLFSVMPLDPDVWGPHYWFTLHTIAMTYPATPNEVTKRKYYDFIQNLPLFLPVEEIGNAFARLLDKYPATPYLESRQSLVRWFHFIHNKVNEGLGKEQPTLEEALTAYYEHYKPREVKDAAQRKRREKIAFACIFAALVGVGLFLSRR